MSNKSAATAVVPFSAIKSAVAKQFEKMKQHQLFRVDLSGQSTLSPEQRVAATGDILWDAYLAAFPEGANPVYKKRTDHDCSCCRHFIRTMGGVVAVVDGRLETIWGIVERQDLHKSVAELGFYTEVLVTMDKLVRSAPIENVFLHTEKQVGTEKSFQEVIGAEAIRWEHFHLHLPTTTLATKTTIGPALSEARSTYDVFKRGLEELTLDSVDTVLELIAQNSLYRGEEYAVTLRTFRALKITFDALTTEREKPLYCWSTSTYGAVKRIRNTAIGTLLIDLSASTELEDAVKKFETSIMAPANYKRPTALVSKAMIEKARIKVEELGFISALERRYARIDDITVNNVLFADSSAKKLQKSAFDALSAAVPEKIQNLERVEEIGIEKFLTDVLPKAATLEVLFENRHAGNLVSLIAPADSGSKPMFKWPNRFSWSYAGENADSIKERVKRAGGKVDGDLRCSLSWYNYDDLDLHMVEPNGKEHIFYGHKHSNLHARRIRR